jgi:hypothetical protein
MFHWLAQQELTALLAGGAFVLWALIFAVAFALASVPQLIRNKKKVSNA